MDAVIGTDKKAPGTPHTSDQKINEATTAAGCKSIPSPKNCGSIKLPIINSVAPNNPSTTKNCGPKPYCKNSTGAGSKTAIIDPTLGMKLSRNTNRANRVASFT